MQELMDSLQLIDHIMAITLGMPRILMVMIILPFMGSQILVGSIKFAVAFSVYLVLHPLIFQQIHISSSGVIFYAQLMALLLKECIIGLCIGLLVGILFWAIQSAGFFIDNQRGLTQAMGADPLSGEQTSPLGSFFFQAIVYIFFAGGVFLVFLQFLYTSYLLYPVGDLLPLQALGGKKLPLLFASQVGYLMEIMLLFSGPVVVACLLTDVSLGLINRFASQLNVYILAMPIKSGIASFLLIFYFGLLVAGFMPLLQNAFSALQDKLWGAL